MVNVILSDLYSFTSLLCWLLQILNLPKHQEDSLKMPSTQSYLTWMFQLSVLLIRYIILSLEIDWWLLLVFHETTKRGLIKKKKEHIVDDVIPSLRAHEQCSWVNLSSFSRLETWRTFFFPLLVILGKADSVRDTVICYSFYLNSMTFAREWMQATLALYAARRTSGIVVNIGFQVTSVVPSKCLTFP